jgi:hypothetical protein
MRRTLRHSAALCLAVIGLLALGPISASAAMQAYLAVKGQKQGKYKDEKGQATSTRKSPKIDLFKYGAKGEHIKDGKITARSANGTTIDKTQSFLPQQNQLLTTSPTNGSAIGGKNNSIQRLNSTSIPNTAKR